MALHASVLHCVLRSPPSTLSFSIFYFLSTHADRRGVDISVNVRVLVRLRISRTRMKLAASYFARQFIGVQGRESYISVNFASPEIQNLTNWQARGPCLL